MEPCHSWLRWTQWARPLSARQRAGQCCSATRKITGTFLEVCKLALVFYHLLCCSFMSVFKSEHAITNFVIAFLSLPVLIVHRTFSQASIERILAVYLSNDRCVRPLFIVSSTRPACFKLKDSHQKRKDYATGAAWRHVNVENHDPGSVAFHWRQLYTDPKTPKWKRMKPLLMEKILVAAVSLAPPLCCCTDRTSAVGMDIILKLSRETSSVGTYGKQKIAK